MNWFMFGASFITLGAITFGSYMIGRLDERKNSINIEFKKFAESLRFPELSCMVCREKRPYQLIDVITHDLSDVRGFEQAGAFLINVKYCNDRIHCYEVAHVLDKWKDWPK
jgi:hypothetical protein